VWTNPAQPPRAPPPPPSAASPALASNARAATEEEEAYLAAEEAEAAAADDAALQEQLTREQATLRTEHRSAARAADTVTPDMYTEVQELLTMFGIPYIIAPAEAEAQCAWLDAAGLVDGVVTDDSDVFLFGARTVYRNIFDAKKFVEVYCAEHVECAHLCAPVRLFALAATDCSACHFCLAPAARLGLDRARLAQLALLLGSDYTPGVAGVGIVNAVEIVSAFPSMEALGRFKAWVDAPESDLVAAAAARAAGRRAPRKAGSSPAAKATPRKDADAAGAAAGPASPPAAAAGAGASADAAEEAGGGGAAEEEFKAKHRGRRTAWVLADSFPAQNVIDAYLQPQVDRSKQRFEWGRPDDAMLRAFCQGTLGWGAQQCEPVLRDILRQHDIHETQRTMQTFFRPQARCVRCQSLRAVPDANSAACSLQDCKEQFAKVRSKRLRNAITGLTGKVDPELSLGDLRADAAPKPKRRKAAPKKKAPPLLAEEEEEGGSDGDGNYVPGAALALGAPGAEPRVATRGGGARGAGGLLAEASDEEEEEEPTHADDQ
jgi:DNA excision repair protein ERCC-5